jgi:hypothetical protein
MNSQKLSEPLHNLIMKSEPALADLHRIPDATGGGRDCGSEPERSRLDRLLSLGLWSH